MAEYNSKVVLGDGTVLIDLTADTVTEDKLLEGYTAHNKSGATITGSCTFDADTTDATASRSEILLSKTAYVNGVKLTGDMPNNGGVTGIISTKDDEYIIPQGYHDGSGKAKISDDEQAKIVPENIKKDITILGVTGSMTGFEDVNAQAKTVTPSFTTQQIIPDSSLGYNYLSQVTVNAIPVTYTGSPTTGVTVVIG